MSGIEIAFIAGCLMTGAGCLIAGIGYWLLARSERKIKEFELVCGILHQWQEQNCENCEYKDDTV